MSTANTYIRDKINSETKKAIIEREEGKSKKFSNKTV